MIDAFSLLSSEKCLVCFGELSIEEALELGLLAQIAGAMNTDPQSLLSSAKCYVCEGASLAQALKLQLLAQISLAHNPANKVDPQSLLTQAQCYSCYSNASIGKLMELALLAQIAT